MSRFLLHTFKASVKCLALVIGALPLAANASLDFSSFTCTEGELLSSLPNNNSRVMVQLYHNGYLISHDHVSGVMRNFDMTDPRNPKQVGGDQNPGNAGHHHYMGVGNVIGFNWAGVNQTRLDDVPNFSRASIVDGTDEAFMVGDASNGHHSEIITFYPIGFGNVPSSYQFDNKPVLTIHDVSKPGNPKIGEINVLDDLGFQGRVNMVGNLLFIRGDNLTGYGVGVYDIADPANPKLLDKIRERSFAFDGQWALGRAYDTMPMYKHYVVNAMNGDTGFQRSVDIIDYSDPTNLVHVSSKDYSGPSMRYPNFKDEYMYVGEAKVDMNTFEEVASFPGAYGEYLLPIGNILVGSGQYRTGTSKVFCDQSQPDTRGPEVGFTWPRPNATGLHVNSRIGVLIHETLDINTLNETNFQIRKVDGTVVPAHVSWWSNGTINVTPKAPLAADTTYEFYMRAGGVKDVAGNGLAEDFKMTFATGNALSGGSQEPVINDLSLSANVVGIAEAVSLGIDARDPQSNPLTYNIDWGDGHSVTAGSATTYSHSYAAAGIYYVNVEAVDSFGNKDTKVIQMVVEAVGLARHYKSSPLVFDAINNRVINVNPDNDTITAIDAVSGAKLFESAVGKDPRTLAVADNGEIWVANYDEGSLSVLNGQGHLLTTVKQMSPGAKPYGVIISPDQKYVYVSTEGDGTVLRYDRASRTKLDTLPVGPYARAMAMTNDGKTLLVTRFISAQDEAQVYKVDLTSFTLAATIKIAADTTSLDTNTSARGVVNYLMGIAIAPGSDIAWVVGKKDNTYRGVTIDGNFGNFQNTVRSVIAKIDISENAEVPNSKFDIDNAEIASAIDFSEGGDIVYIVHQGNNILSAYNVANMQGLDQISMGLAPQGVVVAKDGDVFTHNFLSRTVSRITLFTGSGGSASSLAELSQTLTVANEKLSGEVLAGKRIYYSAGDARMSMDGYMSCASCHIDGRHDGRTRDFTDRGEGLRNTHSLEGRAGTAHGRLHWSANFDEIHDFEHDIRFAFLGTGFMTDADFGAADTTLGYSKAGKSFELDAMNAYVESLASFPQSPMRKWDGALNGQAANGKVIFEAKGCYKCHGGEHFTDSPQGNRHDVGTIQDTSGSRLGGELGGLDTPTLRGLWDTAPYLHDGSAADLSAVLRNEKHLNAGTTDTGLLNATDEAALIAYLQQIDGVEGAAKPIANPINLSGLSHGQSINGVEIALAITTNLSDISEVQYVVDDVVVATLTSAPYVASYKPKTTGLHRVYARAVHNAGRVATLSPELTVDVTALAKPQIIFASTLVQEGVRLDWSLANVSANQYEVYRDLDAEPAGRVRIASINDMSVSSFVDTDVAPDTTYYYWLKVRDSAGAFHNSPLASAQTAPIANLPDSELAQPEIAFAGTLVQEGVRLDWSLANISANQYEVYRDMDAEPAGRVRIASISDMSVSSFVDSDVAPDTTYYYWLKVRDSAGAFHNSPLASAQTAPAPTVPTLPEGVLSCDESNSVAVNLSQDFAISGGECLKFTSTSGADIKFSTWSGGQVVIDVTGCQQDFVVPSGSHTSLGKTGTVYVYIDPTSTAKTIRGDSWGSASATCSDKSSESSSQAVVSSSSVASPISSAAQSSAPSESSSEIALGSNYRIINKMSGKVLDVSGFSTENGALIHQWSYAGTSNQHWHVSANAHGVQLKSLHSAKCLDVPGGASNNGTQVQQWDCANNNNQRFILTNKGNGYFDIRAESIGRCLDYAQDPNSPAKLHLWDCHGRDNQLWRFEKI